MENDDIGKQRRTIAGGAIGTLMEYFDYYLYGLASATVFPAVFFPDDNAVVGTLSSFASFAFGFLLRPVGGLVFGHIGDRVGRKTTLMITVIGMGISTAAIGLIPPASAIGIAAPILLLLFRMLQGLFVGGEMGGAATLVVEHAPAGRRGLYGALLISGAGIANVASAGLMAAFGAGSHSFFITWGWRIPFVFALVLAIVAIVLRSKLEESDEFKELAAARTLKQEPRKSPLKEVFRHPKNAILGILIGLPQSIAGYIVLTFGLAYMVSKGTQAQVGFIGTMIVGVLQIFAAPMWGSLSDRFGRRKIYIIGCIGFALLIYPALALYGTQTAILIWLGMIIGFVIPVLPCRAPSRPCSSRCSTSKHAPPASTSATRFPTPSEAGSHPSSQLPSPRPSAAFGQSSSMQPSSLSLASSPPLTLRSAPTSKTQDVSIPSLSPP